MLLLTRNIGDSVVLYYKDSKGKKKEIKISIIDKKRKQNSIVVGIDAPDDVNILRDEMISFESPNGNVYCVPVEAFDE